MNRNVLTAEMKEFLTTSPTPKIKLKQKYLITTSIIQHIDCLKNLKKSKIAQIFENTDNSISDKWTVEVSCDTCARMHIEKMSKTKIINLITGNYICEECIQEMREEDKEEDWDE